MTPRSETLESRRAKFAEFAELRRQGMSYHRISQKAGVSVHHVRYVLKTIPVQVTAAAWTPRAIAASAPSRPDWSRPDAELLRLAREGRAEIEEALRRARHVP